MPIPTNKAELTTAIQTTYAKLQADLTSVPAELADKEELDGHAKGTKMSVTNLVAYLMGWGELVLKWHKKHQNEEVINFPETGFKWNELGLLAQKFYADYEEDDYETLLKKLAKVVAEILQVIDNQDDESLYNQPFYEKYPLGRMIQLNTSSPYKNARSRVRKWKRERKL